MILQKITDNQVRFIVDTIIYNDSVISKVLYWLADKYLISRNSIGDSQQEIVLESKDDLISENEFKTLKIKLSQDFVDYKTRDIVNKETQNIRDILYIKAFANGDDFEDYNLMTD